MVHGFDVIGDVHGELDALQILLECLGYDPRGEHPDGRVMVFVGDLVDRGPRSLEVATRVKAWTESNRALCLMGNHEYNLVAHRKRLRGYDTPKKSNASTFADIEARESEWQPILDWMQTLPIGLELPDLRVIHACWHRDSVDAVAGLLRPEPTVSSVDSTIDYLRAHVALDAPFARGCLRLGLDTAADWDAPHEVLLKGFEEPCEPFHDSDKKLRHFRRVTWWQDDDARVLRDARTQVFGHYWNCPPLDGHFAPPHPSGHPKLLEWSKGIAARVTGPGSMLLSSEYCCVDFNGLTKANKANGSPRAYVGALRWPEREVVWAG